MKADLKCRFCKELICRQCVEVRRSVVLADGSTWVDAYHSACYEKLDRVARVTQSGPI